MPKKILKTLKNHKQRDVSVYRLVMLKNRQKHHCPPFKPMKIWAGSEKGPQICTSNILKKKCNTTHSNKIVFRLFPSHSLPSL